MLEIDKKTYRISSDNYYKSKPKKKQIVIGFSLRKNDNYLKHMQIKEFGKTKKWNTYTITRDGIIYEHYNPNYYTDFLGKKEWDKQSISIILENAGSLIKINETEYINWLNEIFNNDDVINYKWMGQKYWEKIPSNQYYTTLNLCNELCDKLKIEKKIMDFHNYHEDTVKFNGIVFRSNYIENSTDINPTFNIDKFNNWLNIIEK